VEPLAVGKHAIKSSGITDYSGLTCLVLGGGPIGQAVLYNLKACGPRKLFVPEPTEKRYQQIAELADKTFNPVRDHIGDKCRSLTGGAGVDLVFDCAGSEAGLRDAMDGVRKGGTIVNVAGWGKDVSETNSAPDGLLNIHLQCTIPMAKFSLKELVYRASLGSANEDIKETVEDFIAGTYFIYALISDPGMYSRTIGRFNGVENMVTGRISLGNLVAQGFEALIKHRDDHVKILVTPKPSLLAA
jgi:threonine dehydrogenase-like Zn-dependent dehydrogenase